MGFKAFSHRHSNQRLMFFGKSTNLMAFDVVLDHASVVHTTAYVDRVELLIIFSAFISKIQSMLFESALPPPFLPKADMAHCRPVVKTNMSSGRVNAGIITEFRLDQQRVRHPFTVSQWPACSRVRKTLAFVGVRNTTQPCMDRQAHITHQSQTSCFWTIKNKEKTSDPTVHLLHPWASCFNHAQSLRVEFRWSLPLSHPFHPAFIASSVVVFPSLVFNAGCRKP